MRAAELSWAGLSRRVADSGWHALALTADSLMYRSKIITGALLCLLQCNSVQPIHAFTTYLSVSGREVVSPATRNFKIAASSRKADCSRAEQLYEAASSDARILERAIFLLNFRQEVERALGKRLSDEELRLLATQARAEAHRWYKYLQEPQHGCSGARSTALGRASSALKTGAAGLDGGKPSRQPTLSEMAVLLGDAEAASTSSLCQGSHEAVPPIFK